VIAAIDIHHIARDEFGASSARNAVAAPTSTIEISWRAGAFLCAVSSNSSNSGMPDAARVASGPGEIA
jgi:hypothetical protein